MKKLKGFTLIELLVVIAIIGTLSTVVIMNFSGTKQKAVDTNFLQAVQDASKVATSCIADSTAPVVPTAAASLNAVICSGYGINTTATWPSLPTTGNWSATYASNSTTVNGFKVVYTATSPARTITCTEGGCQKTGF